ncbi:MAG: hypothetical protein NC191_08580 [Muribaculaceae bacterium]|nr:hypothetical protein [Muribaculaceae bacterium]
MFSARVHDLMRRKSDIEYRLTKLTRKLSDLQDYATFVGNSAQGSIDIGEMLVVPGSMMGRCLGFAGGMYNQAMLHAQQNAPFLMQQYMASLGGTADPQTQAMIQQMCLNSMYQAGADIATQKEVRKLKREEEKMKNEKEQLETLAKEVEQELQAARQARDAGIKEMAPKYTAGQ